MLLTKVYSQIINALSIFYNDYQISNIILHYQIFFIKIFGLKNLWVTVIYKTILFNFSKGHKKFYLVIKNYFYGYNVILSLCSSYEIFSDRLIRNQLMIIVCNKFIKFIFN